MDVTAVFSYIGMAVSIATVLVAALDKIAAITPTTKDDQLASTLAKGLSIVVSVLDVFSVHATSDKKAK